ncbi:MAG: hypothetical protein A3E87_04380 [Gammaproteobacteria bacterium RIFCSPHIGHO2_12_FULL_35_23]|nr:MAG: hypothetical protein A3E87_04380 [Gammaproteobacteria bacterium RIFCSPHIGHO2_12_FULL_35_23]
MKNPTNKENAPSLLAAFSSSLPPVIRSEKIQTKTAEVNFDWINVDQVIGVLKAEVAELEEAIHQQQPPTKIVLEFGDILFTCVNLARHLNTNVEMALHLANEKFIRRFQHIEQALKQENKKFTDLSFEQLLEYWNRAKQETAYD